MGSPTFLTEVLPSVTFRRDRFVSNLIRFLLTLLIGVVIFVGLPLLGWGLTDIQGFAADPARFGYIVLVVLLQVFVAIKFPGVGRSGGDGKKLVHRQRLAIFLLQVISLAMVIAAPYCDRPIPRTWSVCGWFSHDELVGSLSWQTVQYSGHCSRESSTCDRWSVPVSPSSSLSWHYHV